MHNEDDSLCARQKFCSQGDTDENGQMYTHIWGAETVGCYMISLISVVIANDWVIGGSTTLVVGLMYSLCQHKSVTTGTSVALRDRMN